MSPQFTHRHARWRKTYLGIPYTVNCSDLKLPEELWTELGSYQAANAWWKAEQLRIDSENTKSTPEKPKPQPSVQAILKDLKEIITAWPPPSPLVQTLDAEIAKGETIGEALDRWFIITAANCEASSIVSLQSYVKRWKAMGDVLTAYMPVTVLSSRKIEDVFNWFNLREGKKSSKAKEWMFFKGFVNHLVESEAIPMPLMLKSKKLFFKVTKTSKDAPDLTRIMPFLDTLPDRLKLYALLAMNTSMNNVDIGELQHRQIDWTQRTLTRKRIKTAGWERVPVVMYRLWPETLRLLTQEMTTPRQHFFTNEFGEKVDYVLLDRNEQPLYLEDKNRNGTGKPYHYDKIKCQWRDNWKYEKEKKLFTLQQFRFFGTDLLKKSPFRSYRQAFLGHSPDSVLEKNYESSVDDVTQVCEYLENIIFPKK